MAPIYAGYSNKFLNILKHSYTQSCGRKAINTTKIGCPFYFIRLARLGVYMGQRRKLSSDVISVHLILSVKTISGDKKFTL